MFIEPGLPWQNGYVESVNGKQRSERLDLLHVKRNRDIHRETAMALQQRTTAWVTWPPGNSLLLQARLA